MLSAPDQAKRGRVIRVKYPPGDKFVDEASMQRVGRSANLPQVASRSSDKVRVSADKMSKGLSEAQGAGRQLGTGDGGNNYDAMLQNTTAGNHTGIGEDEKRAGRFGNPRSSRYAGPGRNTAQGKKSEQTWQISATGRIKYPTKKSQSKHGAKRRENKNVFISNSSGLEMAGGRSGNSAEARAVRRRWQQDTDMHNSRLKAIFGKKQKGNLANVGGSSPSENFLFRDMGRDPNAASNTPSDEVSNLATPVKKSSPLSGVSARETASPSPPPGMAPPDRRRPASLRKRSAKKVVSSNAQESGRGQMMVRGGESVSKPSGGVGRNLVHPNGRPPSILPKSVSKVKHNGGIVGSPLTVAPKSGGNKHSNRGSRRKVRTKLQISSARKQPNSTTLDSPMGSKGDRKKISPSAPTNPRRGNGRGRTVHSVPSQEKLVQNSPIGEVSSTPPQKPSSPSGASMFQFPLWKKKPKIDPVPFEISISPAQLSPKEAFEASGEFQRAALAPRAMGDTEPNRTKLMKTKSEADGIRVAEPIIGEPLTPLGSALAEKEAKTSKRGGFFSFLGGGKKKAKDGAKLSKASKGERDSQGDSPHRLLQSKQKKTSKSAPGLQDGATPASAANTVPDKVEPVQHKQSATSPFHAFPLGKNAKKNVGDADKALANFAVTQTDPKRSVSSKKTKIPTPPKRPSESGGNRFRRNLSNKNISSPPPIQSTSPRLNDKDAVDHFDLQSTQDSDADPLGVSITARKDAAASSAMSVSQLSLSLKDSSNDEGSLPAFSPKGVVAKTGASLFRQSLSPTPIQWKRGEMIGSGTYGDVFMALNQVTGELFCVKQIRVQPGSGGAKEAKARVTALEREISVMKNLEHPHIVRYLGTESHSDAINNSAFRKVFVFLEYVPGGSLSKMLRQFGSFGEQVVCRYSYQILLGLDYLHSQGIIHRDIKGANVLVSEAGVAKLADFGCSKQLQGAATGSMDESLRSIRGSIPWMAPEVIRQSGHGRSADIWSLGATVIEMLTAERPWPELGDSFAALFHVASAKTGPPCNVDISDVCRDFLDHCFPIDPEERWSASELMKHKFVAGVAKLNSGVRRKRPSRGEGVARSSEF